MKKPFQVGDRVRVYGHYTLSDGSEATVTQVYDTMIDLKITGSAELFLAHPKQCRRLKPKAPLLRVWIPNTSLPHDMISPVEDSGWISRDPREGWIEFVEVRRKKS